MEKTIWDEKIETMPPGELFDTIEKKKLAVQLDYVFHHSGFYQKKFRDAGVRLEDLLNRFDTIPFTEKSELIADQIESPPFGRNVCVTPDRIQRVHRTSGTTGRPLFLAVTGRDIESTVNCGARCFYASGMRPGDRVFNCLNYCLWMGGFTDHQSMEKTGATVVPYGTGSSKELIETILLVSPTALHCTPSYLSRLELLLKEEFGMCPGDLNLSKGFFGAEPGMSDPNFRHAIEQTWGITAMNANYGMSDVLSMFGAECLLRDGLHFMGQEYLYPELIDPHTLEKLPFERGVKGELVLTNLEKAAQPVIRFRTRDIIEILSAAPCDCGRSSFRFNVAGRSDDMLVVKGVNLFPDSVKKVLSEFMDSVNGEFQIILDRPSPVEHLKIKVEYRTPRDKARVEELGQKIIARMKMKLFISPQLEMVPEGRLKGADNKSRRIVRKY